MPVENWLILPLVRRLSWGTAMRLFLISLGLYACLSAAFGAEAPRPNDTAPVARRITLPRVLTVPDVELPPYDLKSFSEGWYLFHIWIAVDGTVSRIELRDGFHSFRNDWLETLVTDRMRNIRWQPATENGRPIEWEGVELQVVKLRRKPETRYGFGILMEPIDKALANKDYASAKTQILDLIKTDVTRLGEFGLLKLALYKAEMGLQNPHGARRAIEAPTRDASAPILDYSDLVVAFKNRVKVDQALGDYGDALETYDRLEKITSRRSGQEIDDLVAEMRAAVRGSAPIVTSLEFDGDGEASTIPVRSRFSIDGGPVRAVWLFCGAEGGSAASLSVPSSGTWSVDGIAAGCRLVLEGEPGARFTLNQLN